MRSMSVSPYPPLPPELSALFKLSGQKARQHYVFQAYLRPWFTGKQVAVLRNGLAKMVGLSDVAIQNYFYRLQRLTEEDVALIRNTLLATASDFVRKLAELLIQCFTLPRKIQDRLKTKTAAHSQASRWIEEQIVNGEENYHCTIESSLIPAIEAMLQGDTSLYSDSKACYEFLYAVCVQYFRTKKMRTAMGAVKSPYPGSDMNRVRSLFTLISAMKVADSLYVERSRHKIIIVENQTTVSFLTGDQPIINIHATHGQGVPEDLEFYYPLSPARAMMLVRVETDVARFADDNRVNTLNSLIVKNSRKQVFSNSVTQLQAVALV